MRIKARDRITSFLDKGTLNELQHKFKKLPKYLHTLRTKLEEPNHGNL